MDPLSIATAASSLTIAIFTASKYIHDFIDNAKNVDQRVKDLAAQIDQLLTILQAMKNVFDTPGTQAVLKGAKDIGTLLGAVKTSIDDCTVTAKEVENIFEVVAKEKGDSKTLLSKAFRQFKLNTKQDDIDKLNALIQQHKTNMQLSLQTVNVLVACLSPQAVTDVLAPKMDELRAMLKEMKIAQYDQEATVDVNVVQHSQALQSTAQFFVQRQSLVSPVDDDDWMRISRHGTGLSKVSGKDTPLEYDDVLDSDEEMEADLSNDLLDSGIKLCDEGKYKEAESTLKNSIQDAMRKKLMDRHRSKIKQAQMKLGVAYLWQEKFDAADPVLKGIAALPANIKGMDDHLPLTLDAAFYLAQISLAYHDFTAALRECQKAVKGRKKLLGKEHPGYTHALNLLVLIQKTSGDEISANAYTKQIPENMRKDRTEIAVLKYSAEGMDMSVSEQKEAIKVLDKFGPGHQDASGGHNLRWAAIEGHLGIVKLLLYREAPIEGTDFRGSTALASAAANGYADIVDYLIKKGANVNSRFPENPPLHQAIRKDSEDCVRLLLENGAKIDAPEVGVFEFDFSMVMTAAYQGANRTLPVILAAGAKAEVCNKSHRRTALMYAAREGQSESVAILLKAGADPNKIDNEGQSALVFAAEGRRNKVVEMLLAHGAKPDPPLDAPKFAPTPLCIAARYEGHEMLTMLLKKGADPNRTGRGGTGPLVTAADLRNGAASVKLLLKHGADPNKQVVSHKHAPTPLYKALNNDDTETVNLLLEAGADVNQVSYENCSPLDTAQRRRLDDIVELLFEKGATLEGKNMDNEKA